MLGGGHDTGMIGSSGAFPWCVSTVVLAGMGLLGIGVAAVLGRRHAGCSLPPCPPATCSFDMLTFYYDDDDELHCECLDDFQDDDWWLDRCLG